MLFSTSKDKTIKMWDLQSEKEVFQYALSFTPSSVLYESRQKLLFAIESNKIHVFDSQLCIDKPIKVIQESKPISYAILDDNSRLWVASDKNVSIHNFKLNFNIWGVNSNRGNLWLIMSHAWAPYDFNTKI